MFLPRLRWVPLDSRRTVDEGEQVGTPFQGVGVWDSGGQTHWLRIHTVECGCGGEGGYSDHMTNYCISASAEACGCRTSSERQLQITTRHHITNM